MPRRGGGAIVAAGEGRDRIGGLGDIDPNSEGGKLRLRVIELEGVVCEMEGRYNPEVGKLVKAAGELWFLIVLIEEVFGFYLVVGTLEWNDIAPKKRVCLSILFCFFVVVFLSRRSMNETKRRVLFSFHAQVLQIDPNILLTPIILSAPRNLRIL